MRSAGINQAFAGGTVLFQRDGLSTVAGGFVFPRHGVTEGIHQPRLSTGVFPEFRENGCIKYLPRGLGVLGVERLHFSQRETAHAQGCRFDIEGTAARDHFLIPLRDAVIAHITHPAEDHTLRERNIRSSDIAFPQLAQQRNECVADQRIDFINHQHDGFAGFGCPAGE